MNSSIDTSNAIRNKRKGIVLGLISVAAVAAIAAGLMTRSNVFPLEAKAGGQQKSSPEAPSASPVVEGADVQPLSQAADARFDLALPELEVVPEVFAQLSENPFRCGVRSSLESPCDWRSDPSIARSPAEARWMAAYGYPTTDEREWAERSTTNVVLAEAKRTGSPALWALALQRSIDESASSEEASRHLRALRSVAERGRSLYALEQSALASMHVADLILAEADDPLVRDSRTGRVESLMSVALSDIAMATALGDPGAMTRVLQRAPVDLPEVYGGSLNGVTPAYAAEKIQDAFIELRRNQALADRGVLTVRTFTVADIAPRPKPVLVRNTRHGDIWTGER